MKSLIIVVFLAAAVAAKLAPLYTHLDRISGRYMVKLKEGRSVDATLATLSDHRVYHRYDGIFPGFAARLTEGMVDKLRASDAVEYIEEDSVVRADTVASWGLDRIDQLALPLDDQYDPIGDGAGVDVYILDTGINYDHVDFDGRVQYGYDPISGTGVDCNGHGSHCAGTAAGTVYGVAKAANLYAVRVLNCFGTGSTADIVEACEYVATSHSGPSVASMSLGGGVSATLDAGITAMIDAGVTVSVSAGNDDMNACNKSPARVAEAITVGATDDADTRAYFSNYGPCVDIFGPGVAITSAWYDSPNSTNTISGTSMSCPHVTGAAAILLGMDPTLTPRQAKEALQIKAIANVVNDAQTGSPNLLLYMGDGTGGGFIPEPFDSGCGGYFNDTMGNVTSPWYPSNYEDGESCDYLITGDMGFIDLKFNEFELESSSRCQWDSLTIYDGADDTAPLTGVYCGTDSPGSIRSNGSSLFMHFQSDGSITRPGFHATYTIAESGGCGHTFKSDYGSMTSPNYPEQYGNNEDCMMTIEGQPGVVVTLTFQTFDLEKHTDCSYDRLRILDGTDASGQILADLCGSDLPDPVKSSVGKGMLIHFTSDKSVTRGGFAAQYEIS